MHNKILGKWGEDLAARYLEGKGYKILAKNYSCRHGEIDIIASFEGAIIFVEVKTRMNTSFGWPEEAVTEEKMRHLGQAAEKFLIREQIESDYYFEVLSLLVDRNKKSVRVKHFKNF